MPTYKIKIPMIDRNDFLCAPPYGHLGVLIENTNPAIKAGDDIIIDCLEETLIRGVVIAIEPPGQCLRADLEAKSKDKYKIHWVPYDPHAVTEGVYKRLHMLAKANKNFVSEIKALKSKLESKSRRPQREANSTTAKRMVPAHKSGNGSRNNTRRGSQNHRA